MARVFVEEESGEQSPADVGSSFEDIADRAELFRVAYGLVHQLDWEEAPNVSDVLGVVDYLLGEC